MERLVKRIIGFILLGLGGIIEATEWITVLHEHVPAVLTKYVDHWTAVIIFAVGILFLFIGRGAEETASTPVALPPSIKNEVNPTINANPTITVINNPPQEPPKNLPLPTPAIVQSPHNVQYLRTQEFSHPEEQTLIFAACFENVPIPHQAIKTFNYVKVKAVHTNLTTGKPLRTIFPGAWAERNSEEVFMKVGEPFYATIARSVEGKWSAVEVTHHNTHYGTFYEQREHPLPPGDSIVAITLVGDHGVSIPSELFHLRIETDGTASVRHLPAEDPPNHP